MTESEFSHDEEHTAQGDDDDRGRVHGGRDRIVRPGHCLGHTHTHSKATGNGSCVLLAPNGGEKGVILPNATGSETRRHPLHVNVHLGEPGAGGHIQIGVAGSTSDPCYDDGNPIDYLND